MKREEASERKHGLTKTQGLSQDSWVLVFGARPRHINQHVMSLLFVNAVRDAKMNPIEILLK